MRPAIFSLFLSLLLPVIFQSAMAYDLYLTRHFEKQSGGKDPELTELGAERAAALAILLKDAHIKQVYSTDYNRTQMTATPVAQMLKIDITSYNPRELESFAKSILSTKQNTLIVGHSNTTPMLVHLLGGQAQSIDESEYGDLFKISIEENKVSTEIVKVPPISIRNTQAISVKPIKTHKTKLRMMFNGEEVGYAVHEFVVDGGKVRATEHTSIPAMKIDATIELHFDAETLETEKMQMTGAMGAPVDIEIEGTNVRVSGHSSMARQAFKPQGKILIDQALAQHTYERTTVLMNMPHIAYSSDPQLINWFNAYDNEVKKIAIRKTGEKHVTVPAGSFSTDIVEVVGGAPSQIYYLDADSSAVIKIEIPGMPWVYEKTE